MKSVSSLFGGSNAFSVSNPEEMPKSAMYEDNLKLKSNTAIYDVTSSDFWTNLDRFGAVHSQGVFDAYETLVSISGGGGFVGNIITPHADGNIKITLDGVEYIINYNTNAGYRAVLGTVGYYDASTSSNTSLSMHGGANDKGFYGGTAYSVGGASVAEQNTATIINPFLLRNAGLPMLRFKDSLLVEVAGNNSTADNREKSGITYILD